MPREKNPAQEWFSVDFRGVSQLCECPVLFNPTLSGIRTSGPSGEDA
jgi:hypothetical protein